jgi:maleylpyruvate isomerase
MTGVRDLAAGRRWTAQGTELFLGALSRTGDAELTGRTSLPGWTGRHLVAHVAANAEALLNLVHWAATGDESPMYASPQQRDRDIEAGSRLPPSELRRWAEQSAGRLAVATEALSDEQWSRPVRTAQGRTVPASEVPWLRAREVMVHTVDLDPTLGFWALPEDFLRALVDDVVGRRSATAQQALLVRTDDGQSSWEVLGPGLPTEVRGSLPSVAAYLAGRGGAGVQSPSGDVPDLPPWL